MNARQESIGPGSEAVAPTLDTLYAARKRISNDVITTPLLRSRVLDDLVGGVILVKAECLQPTGTFKVRGAFNRLRQLSPQETQRGVVTWSSGNHAQAVAAAAKAIGAPATILMPSDAVPAKVALTKSHGPTVIFFNRETDDRQAIVQRIVEESGATRVPPADDPHVISGQGTAALELLEQAQALGLDPEALLTPCGSGGLTAGSAIAFAALRGQAQVYGVEPEAFDDTTRSLAAGKPVANRLKSGSICDALLANMPGALTFAVNLANGVRGLTVSDGEVLKAVAFAFRHFKLVLEPSGAAALAAILTGKIETKGRVIAIVCSGGNADPALFAKAIEAEAK